MTDLFSGYSITIQVNGQTIAERFVIPAIVDEATIVLLQAFQAQDAHAEYTVKVEWDQQAERPLYAVDQIEIWPTENAARAFADVWSKTAQ